MICESLHQLISFELLPLTKISHFRCRKCVDKDGYQTVFVIHKNSSNIQWLWKATVKIAIVTVHTETREIKKIKMINLKQFLHLFKTMTTNVEAMSASEEHQRSANNSPAGNFFPTSMLNDSRFSFSDITSEDDDCCIICMERKPEVILSCLHSFCTLCIEQWNETGSKSCPTCLHYLPNTLDSWVPLEIPQPDEINDEIMQQLKKMSG